MRAGQFNLNKYIDRLYEETEENEKAEQIQSKKSTPAPENGFMDGGEGLVNNDGIIIPEENKKSYDWLKKEFQKGKVEVKVEMNIGGSNFKPEYDLQTDLDSVKDFKPGMFGEIKTAKSEKKEEKPETSGNLDPKKNKDTFKEGESEKTSEEKSENSKKAVPFKKKESEAPVESKKEVTDEKPTDKKAEDKDNADVKKVDLKTKKK